VALPEGASDEARVRALCELAERSGGGILVAVDDSGAVFVQEHGDALRPHFAFSEQPPGLVEELTSKRGLQSLCEAHGVPTARSGFPRDTSELVAYAKELELPLMVKRVGPSPPSAVAAPRMAMARDEDELVEAFARLGSVAVYGERAEESNVMVEEYIPGGHESSWIFNGYFDGQGACKAAFTGLKLRESPPGIGAATLGECRANAELSALATGFAAAVGYRGPVDMDFRRDARDGRYKLLDVNARIGASFRLFVDREGIDVLRAMYLDLTGAAVLAGAPPDGRRWIVEPLDLRSSAIMISKRELTVGGWLRSLRGVREGAWWARDDPAPLPAVMWQLGAGKARKAVRGLCKNA
jgi:predicted ATP-grasp superfamily ATP-dependent carboligase